MTALSQAHLRHCNTCNNDKSVTEFRVGNTQCNECKRAAKNGYIPKAKEAKDCTPEEIRDMFRISK